MKKILLFHILFMMAFISCKQENGLNDEEMSKPSPLAGMYAFDDHSGLTNEIISFVDGKIFQYIRSLTVLTDDYVWNTVKDDLTLINEGYYSVVSGELYIKGLPSGPIHCSDGCFTWGDKEYRKVIGYKSDYYSIITVDVGIALISSEKQSLNITLSIDKQIDKGTWNFSTTDTWIHPGEIENGIFKLDFDANESTMEREGSVVISFPGAKDVSVNITQEGCGSSVSYFQSLDEARLMLNGCYSPLLTIYKDSFLIATESVTDLAYCRNSASDASLDISPGSPGVGTVVWQNCYRGISRINSTISGLEASFPLASIVPLVSEAKTLRSLYYYILTCFFGDVPFYEQEVTQSNSEQISHLPRMSAIETRRALCEELLEFAPDLEQTRSCTHCGAATTWMLIAKMSMWNKNWQMALDALGHLKTIYGDLSQYLVSDILFRNKNTQESIFEIQHSEVASSNCASICLPYPKGEGDMYDGVSIPELGAGARAVNPLRPTTYMTNILMPVSIEDERRSINMVSNWNGENFSRIWMGPKFWCPNMINSNDLNSYPIFRYADAVLMMAECKCEQGDYDGAISSLNEVRLRAGLTSYGPLVDSEKLQADIRQERARELFGEFQRKFDLVRWGIWHEVTVRYNNNDILQNHIRPCHEYYPIPQTQVVLSAGALDNSTYDDSY